MVPILLGTYVLSEGGAHAHEVYDLVFVVVVVLQGGLVPQVARLCRVPMRIAGQDPPASTAGPGGSSR